jgi:hypothetical protein
MRYTKPFLATCCLLALMQLGCRRNWNLTQPACKNAISEYYSTRPECLRTSPDPMHPELGKLCYGYRSVVSIDSFTPPWNGMPRTSHVVYHYTIDRVPDWARSHQMQERYPDLQKALNGSHQATDNLVGSAGGDDSYDWSVIPPGHLVS